MTSATSATTSGLDPAAAAAVPGDPTRPGAHADPDGTSFAVFSSAAAHGGHVELCLLDDDGGERRVPMVPEHDVWHVRVPGAGPGQRYGYRVSVATGAPRGAGALLLDPYARAMTPAPGGGPRDLHGVVVDPAFDWGDDTPPRRAWADTVLYEVHVKGLTMRHPDVPAALRGTYAGLAQPPVLEHLTSLGVTAVELLPVHQFLTEPFLLDKGLTNYWGYSTIGFFAPHAGFSASGTRGEQVREFREMVRALHGAGLEVILDVVYNHTAEGGEGEAALSLRGLADDVYYRHHDGAYYDTTGTGNSLATGRPETLRLIMDSLRYWVTEMHVDGFRFDLAAALAREGLSVDGLSAFFALVYQDPVLSRVKLIAEPWDVGQWDSYQVGRFPAGWAEWNDRYRDAVRDFWRGDGRAGDLAVRLAGSSDLYGAARRSPDASVNVVTTHDGMTLHDLVTYSRKHNEANREGNRDGTDDNRSANYGVEGETGDPAVTAVRERQRRNLLATLLLSQGVPMLLGGDELGRTQGGNTNAYCQDNEISWYDWPGVTTSGWALVAFTRRVIGLQAAQPALRRRTFLTGTAPSGAELPDASWYDHDGSPMAGHRWADPAARCVGLLLAGDRVDPLDARGRPQRGDDVLLVLNSHWQDAARFVLPGRPAAVWTSVLDTGHADGAPTAPVPQRVGAVLVVPPRTVVVATSPI
ncbi:MAG: glycogen debranching protein GlgX [Kineosporiaceae bacterium]